MVRSACDGCETGVRRSSGFRTERIALVQHTANLSLSITFFPFSHKNKNKLVNEVVVVVVEAMIARWRTVNPMV